MSRVAYQTAMVLAVQSEIAYETDPACRVAQLGNILRQLHRAQLRNILRQLDQADMQGEHVDSRDEAQPSTPTQCSE
eukprot:1153114-Pelagomonas_calceolata.AAC.2